MSSCGSHSLDLVSHWSSGCGTGVAGEQVTWPIAPLAGLMGAAPTISKRDVGAGRGCFQGNLVCVLCAHVCRGANWSAALISTRNTGYIRVRSGVKNAPLFGEFSPRFAVKVGAKTFRSLGRRIQRIAKWRWIYWSVSVRNVCWLQTSLEAVAMTVDSLQISLLIVRIINMRLELRLDDFCCRISTWIYPLQLSTYEQVFYTFYTFLHAAR
jgi:hypothetical protein